VKPRPPRARHTERPPSPAGGPATSRGPVGAHGIQRLAGGAHAGSKVQQRFARLIKQVDQRKRRLRTWYDAQPAIQRELATYRACLEDYQRIGHDLVVLLDRAYPDPIFTRAERKQLQAAICEIAGDLLGTPGFDDLKPIYNRHARSDFDVEAAFGDAVHARAMKSMMEEMFGVDFGDADVSSTEKLHAFTEAQLHAFEEREAQVQAEAQERRGRRKKSAKQQDREAQREAEKTQVGKVLQDVFRKLAVALHPDLEQDPAERARKTVLMQQVNVAYEAKDLLRLLELQLELEQIDPEHASNVAEDRLRHYNAILAQQVKELDGELDDLEMPWRMDLDLLPSAQLSPAQVLAQVGADCAELRREGAALRRDLEKFQDVAKLKTWLKRPAGRSPRRSSQSDLFR
jgi:hypothetical protein